jgi:hypothetical protein
MIDKALTKFSNCGKRLLFGFFGSRIITSSKLAQKALRFAPRSYRNTRNHRGWACYSGVSGDRTCLKRAEDGASIGLAICVRSRSDNEIVDTSELLIMSSKPESLRTLAAASSAESMTIGVSSFILRWRTHEKNGPTLFGLRDNLLIDAKSLYRICV